MQHTVEDISPVKKRIAVTVPADEVDAALDRATRQYRARVTLPGFRKGKAPMAMVGKRFARDIHDDALNNLLEDGVSGILRELGIEPLGDLSFENDDAPLARGGAFSYAFSFELMPHITLPPYEGIGVEEDEPQVEEAEIDGMIDRVRRGMAEREDVAEKRLAENGDVLVVDFAGHDENGEPVDGVSGEDFSVVIGDGQVIPDFEALAKTVLPGESGEGGVTFPNDYGNASLAGKTVTMKITVKRLQTRTFPEVDDDFAKKAGSFDSVQAMRDTIRDSYLRNRKEMAKAKAQSLLLEKLLAGTDFPLPGGMLARYTENLLHGKLEERARKDGDAPSPEPDELTAMREEAGTEAGKFAKTQLFLLAVAKKEELDVTGQEMTAALRSIAARTGRDFKEVQENYARHNLFPALRDRILADKAMDRLYEKAAPEKTSRETPSEAAAGESGSE